MKKTILLLIFLTFTVINLNCSSDDNSTSLTTEEQKLLGKWEVTSLGYINSDNSEVIVPITADCYNSYTFTNDKKVNYKNYWDCSDMDEENGIWSINNSILVREFPEDVLLIMTDRIVFMNENKIKLYDIDDESNFSIYEKTN